jgi:hypothetical protein
MAMAEEEAHLEFDQGPLDVSLIQRYFLGSETVSPTNGILNAWSDLQAHEQVIAQHLVSVLTRLDMQVPRMRLACQVTSPVNVPATPVCFS